MSLSHSANGQHLDSQEARIKELEKALDDLLIDLATADWTPESSIGRAYAALAKKVAA